MRPVCVTPALVGTAVPCGTGEAAICASGRKVSTPNAGRKLFRDPAPRGGGVHDGATVFVPLLDATARARAELRGTG